MRSCSGGIRLLCVVGLVLSTLIPTIGQGLAQMSSPAGLGSLAVNGTTSYAEVADSPDLNITGDWSVETWFKDDDPNGFNHDYRELVMKGDSNTSSEAPYFVLLGFNEILAGVRTGGQDYPITWNLAYQGLDPKAWHHVAVTFRSDLNVLNLWLDGTHITYLQVPAHSATGNTLPLEIARNGPSTGKYFFGKLADLRIWSYAATGTQIFANYLSELGPQTGLVGNWHFNDGTGSVAADSAGSHNASLLGGAVFISDAPPNLKPPVGPPPTNTPTPTPTTTTTQQLPPDPSTVAPPLDRSVATTLGVATQFLYTGSNPIQTGVAPNTIDGRRVSILRGRVMTRSNQPLPGATITVLNHPEFGRTLSRADGMFDLAVNGGGLLTVNFALSGYLSAQRQIQAPWQDYALLPDVVLIQIDSAVTTVDLTSSAPIQVARGSVTTDDSGTRQVTLLVPQGTTATMVLSNGSSQTLNTLHIRATEYTVGATGPRAMPADLPPMSAYTYALELSADEALAAGGAQVNFNQPLPLYLENFLNFPTGQLVPVGVYDRGIAQWVASDNGIVVKILSTTGGVASLDVDGSGHAASTTALSALGIAPAELTQLASLYSAGQTLWRAPIAHFSPWDCNWPYIPPVDGVPPNQPLPERGRNDPPVNNPCQTPASIIGCETQTLGERVSITGIHSSLNYQSSRQTGDAAASSMVISLSGPNPLPKDLADINLVINVAGRSTMLVFPAQTNQRYTFTWDGKDAYGRQMQGSQTATVKVGYRYHADYSTPQQVMRTFAQYAAAQSGNTVFQSLPTRQDIIVWQIWQEIVEVWDERPHSLGGWTLDMQHVYDPVGGRLYLGDGRERSDQGIAVIGTVAGVDPAVVQNPGGDGGPARLAALSNPYGVAAGADGSVFITEVNGRRIRRVGPDGIIQTMAGTGNPGYSGDGGPATSATLNYPASIVVGSDGSLFFADVTTSVIRKITPDGIIHTVAGNGTRGFGGDGGAATQAQLNFPFGVALAPDGSLFIADYYNQRIRRVTPGGLISTVAGGATTFPPNRGDGGPATQAYLAAPTGVAVGMDGTLYIADGTGLIWRVGQDGIIHAIGGDPTVVINGVGGDGGPATRAQFRNPTGIAVDSDGTLYIADTIGRIRRIGTDGIITTLAGIATPTSLGGYGGDGGPAAAAQLFGSTTVAFAPDRSLLVADSSNNAVRRIGPALPGLGLGQTSIASDDGNELYVFDPAGRHLRTLDTFTGAIRYAFSYDSAGRLVRITDVDGSQTTIQRDSSGAPTAIVAPGGQTTSLSLDGNGYLRSITDPMGNVTQLASNATGLLTMLTDARGGIHRFEYDSFGRLSRDTDPAGVARTFSRSDSGNGFSVTQTLQEFITTYQVDRLPDRSVRRTLTLPGGAQWLQVVGMDGTMTTTRPDGSSVTVVAGADPRFGMQAPIALRLVESTPAGLARTRTVRRAISLTDPNNPLSLRSLTDTFTVDGQTSTRTYDAATRTFSLTTAAGRTTQTMLDANGRIVRRDFGGGVAPVTYTYDTSGRLFTVTQGNQSSTYSYDALNRLTSTTDAASEQVVYTYDGADRATSITSAGGRNSQFAYDANGNAARFTLPSGAVHTFGYSPVDLESSYQPPASAAQLTRSYTAARGLFQIVLPSGRTETLMIDSFGRPSSLNIPEANTTLSYTGASDRPQSLTRTPSGGGATESLAFGYDGPLVTSATFSGPATGAFSYAYNADFLSTIAVSGGPVDNLTHDADGLLTGYGNFAFQRDGPFGQPTRISDGAFTETISYDSLGRRASASASVGTSVVYTYQLTYDNVGRTIRRMETGGGTSTTLDYQYDRDGQLTGVRSGGASVETYTYDSDLNRSSRQIGVQSEIATYDTQDRLLQRGNTTYVFNADGFISQRGSDTFSYATDGTLVAATAAGQVITYGYDGLRRLVSRTDASGTRQFLYGNPGNDLQLTASRDATGALTTYTYDPAGHLVAFDRGGARFYVATDAVGSPRVIADATGNLLRVITYDSFGNVQSDTTPGFYLPIGFAGGLSDPATGLIHLGLRDYEPASGRFTARDSALFGGERINLYAYAGNNPIGASDPTGLFSIDVSLCVGVCVGTKITITSEGYSACVEGGIGIGVDLGVDPTSSELDKEGADLYVKATASAGPVSADVSASQSLTTPCSNVTWGVGALGFRAEQSLDQDGKLTDISTSLDPTHDMSQYLEAAAKPSLGKSIGKLPKGISASAKAVARYCNGVNW